MITAYAKDCDILDILLLPRLFAELAVCSSQWAPDQASSCHRDIHQAKDLPRAERWFQQALQRGLKPDLFATQEPATGGSVPKRINTCPTSNTQADIIVYLGKSTECMIYISTEYYIYIYIIYNRHFYVYIDIYIYIEYRYIHSPTIHSNIIHSIRIKWYISLYALVYMHMHSMLLFSLMKCELCQGWCMVQSLTAGLPLEMVTKLPNGCLKLQQKVWKWLDINRLEVGHVITWHRDIET